MICPYFECFQSTKIVWTFLNGPLNSHAFQLDSSISGLSRFERCWATLNQGPFFSREWLQEGKTYSKSLDVSVIRMELRFGLNGWTVVVVVSNILTRSNSLSMSSVQTQAIPFFSSGRSAAVIWAKSGTNDVSWFTRPRNDLSWETLVAVGNSAIARYLLLSGLMPAWLMIYPAKVISFPPISWVKMLYWGHDNVRGLWLPVPVVLPGLGPRWWCCWQFSWPMVVLLLFCLSDSATRLMRRWGPWEPWDIGTFLAVGKILLAESYPRKEPVGNIHVRRPFWENRRRRGALPGVCLLWMGMGG